MATKSPLQKPLTKVPTKAPAGSTRETVFEIFRRWGYLQATLDPLKQYLPAEPFPIDVPEGPDTFEARSYYCGNIALEFSHIASSTERRPSPIIQRNAQ